MPRVTIVRVVSPSRVAATLALVALAGVVIATAHLHPVAPLHGAPLVLPGVQRPASHERLRFLECQEPPTHLGSVGFGVGVGEPRARLAVRGANRLRAQPSALSASQEQGGESLGGVHDRSHIGAKGGVEGS